MKTLCGRRPGTFRLALLSVLIFYLAACEVDTRISLADARNPPTFELSGNGSLILFLVVGPYSSAEEVDSKRGVQAIWEISPGEHAGESVGNLPPITYGSLPPGFRQKTPSSGAPPPLEEGKFYSIGAPSIGANFRGICFTVEGGEVIKASCRER